MHVLLGILLEADLAIHGAGLVVQTVGAGDQLTILPLTLIITREPGLQIELLGGGIIQRAGDDRNGVVREAEGLARKQTDI